jgi:4-amino-4-deoxy-L-arabinose transferase-like glycosyltransferase
VNLNGTADRLQPARPQRGPVARLALTLALTFFAFNAANILHHGPYPIHGDETYLADHAWEMVKSGDLDPHFFNYGSLPIYLTAGAQAVGAWVAQRTGEIDSLAEAEPVSYPYYAVHAVSYAPRLLFAALASAALFMVGLLAFELCGTLPAVALAMVVLALDAMFQRSAWVYLNVDIVVTALAAGALVFLNRHLDDTGFRAQALIPGVLCGAALASKYNAGLLLAPFVVAILRSQRGAGAIRRLGALGAITALVFLLCEPYALLRADELAEAVQHELQHYRSGHGVRSSEPGLPHLGFQLKALRKGLGWVTSVLIVLGCARALGTRVRGAALSLLYPLLALGFMCMQRTNFSRNLVPALACTVPFVGLGYATLEAGVARALQWLAQRARPHAQVRTGAWLAKVLTLLIVAGALARSHPARPNGRVNLARPDSRQELGAWLAASEQRDACTLLVPRQLFVHPDSVAAPCRLEPFEVSPDEPLEQLAGRLEALRGEVTYLGLPRWQGEGTQQLAALPQRLNLGTPRFQAGKVPLPIGGERMFGVPYVALYAFSSAPRAAN